ncbi:MAG TPA: YbaK/EbsC family protein [Thermoanaerobaculia bacterium]|nr:YbaK/EbsC family protein [Thermoanaerobaculia bacterium]
MQNDRSILHPLVQQALAEHQLDVETLACREEWADTAPFCEHYGFPADEVCNTIIVVLKKTPREYAACLVRSDSKLDVNHRVASAVSFKRLSFAGPEETAALSGMEIGGVTLIGLPAAMPLLIDKRVMERQHVILGGGNRTSKVRLRPVELLKLPGARVEEIAGERGATAGSGPSS